MRRAGLWQDAHGVSAVEFALLAPLLLTMVFGLFFTALSFWQSAVLNQTAYSAARCAAIGDVQCANVSSTASFAAALGTARGVGLTANAVTATINTTCGGISNMVQVVITKPVTNPFAGLLPMLPQQLTGASCVPRMAS